MQLSTSPATNSSQAAPPARSSEGALSVSGAPRVSLSPELSPSSSVAPDTSATSERPVSPAVETSEANDGVVLRPALTADEPAQDNGEDEGAVSVRRFGGESGDNDSETRGAEGPGVPGEPAREDQERVRELQARDQEVRQQEQLHRIVGGQYAGVADYAVQRGPDGQLYAIDGEVSIDTAPIPDDPQATIDKMRIVRTAALAPADPSPQDLQIALEATRQMLAAQGELRAERQQEVREPLEGSEERDSDPRIEAFRDVAATQDPLAMQGSGTRVDAIA